jgi:putative ABC transport system ATP-binding protein
VRELLFAHRGRVLLAAGLLGAHQAFEALVPVVVGATIDDAIAPGDGSALLLWVGVLIVLFALLSTAYREGARAEERVRETAAHELRMRLLRRVVDPRGGGEGGLLPGQLLSVATADVDAAAGVIAGVAFGSGVIVALITGTVVLLLTSLTLGLTVLVGLPLIVWAGGRLGALLSDRAAGQQASAADASGVAADLVTGLRVLQGIGAADAGAARYRAASQSSLRTTLAAARAEIALSATAVLVGGAAVAGVAFVGGRLAATGKISLGEVIAAVGVTQFMVGPLTRLAWVGGLLARARASAARLRAVLDAPVEFEPPQRPVPLADVLGFEVGAGALLGVVADDPEALLARLRRAAVGVVAPHDAPLLSGTIRDHVSDASALEAAAAADVIEAHGLDTALSDAGSSLSGGQRQRIALARALATRAPVLVLHDPTTALDAATEARVAEGIRRARSGLTTLLVTTSPMLLAACDAVAFGDRVATHAEWLGDAAYREAVA